MIQLQLYIQISITEFVMFLVKAWRSAAFGLYGYLNFTKAGYMEHSKNFRVEDMQGRMEGKNCVVTGANAGIGFATAQDLASRYISYAFNTLHYIDLNQKLRIVLAYRGASVYLLCRSKERGEAALSKIQTKTGNQNVYLEVCDLSSVSEIKSFTARFSSSGVPLHVLVNNAGILENNRVITSEGLETNFAVNVLGTYVMTESMLPLLEKAAPDARVITISSGGMYTAPLTKDLQFSEEKFDGVMQYARNKRVQIALTETWAEKYKDKGIGFYAMHPGWAKTPGVAKSLPGFSERFSGKLRTWEEGADTIIWLAFQPKEKLVSGGFYFDRAEAPKHLPFAVTAGSHAFIDSIIEKLRSLSGLTP